MASRCGRIVTLIGPEKGIVRIVVVAVLTIAGGSAAAEAQRLKEKDIRAAIDAVEAMTDGLTTAEARVSEEDIQAAINIGYQDGKLDNVVPSCSAALTGFGRAFKKAVRAGLTGSGAHVEFVRVVGLSPLAIVAINAREHAEKYLPAPTLAASAGTVERDVFIVVVSAPDLMSDAPLKHVVIRPRGSKNRQEVVQPLNAEVEAKTAVAIFDSAAVLQIAERKDVQVMIVTGAGEVKCNLDDKRIRRAYSPAAH